MLKYKYNPLKRLGLDLVGEEVDTKDNYVLVKTKSDLPTPVAGVITLASNAVYEINGTIVLGTDRLVTSGDVRILSDSALLNNLVYTGSSAMITAVDHAVSISNLTIVSSTAGSTVFNCSDTTNTKNFIFMNSVVANSQSIGIVGGYNNILFDTNYFTNNNNGVVFNGGIHLFLVSQNFDENNSGVYVDVSTGTYELIMSRSSVYHAGIGTTGLYIDDSVVVVDSCSIIGNTFLGSGTLTDGFTVNTSDYVVKANSGLADFVAGASMVISATATNLNVPASTWTKIAGTTSLDFNSRFSMPSNNRLTYNGAEDVTVKINVSLSCSRTSGGSRVAEIGVYKNGVLVAGSQNGFTIYSSDEPCSTNLKLNMATNDYIEVWFQKFGGGSDNYLFSFLNVEINE